MTQDWRQNPNLVECFDDCRSAMEGAAAASLGAVRNDASNPLADLASVREWALNHIAEHPEPDFHVGPSDDHQLQRWFILPRNPFANVYLHRFLRSDDDRAIHDHPWDNRSWVLAGEYLEHCQDGSIHLRKEGDVIERKAIEAHRVELIRQSGPAVTLFFTGPIIRSWGFYCPKGWVPWREFVTTEEGGNRRGQGCGEDDTRIRQLADAIENPDV